ncbi:hypothetical protein WMZ97_09895 [Lentibacillus sp. N15]|uniref:hypothetical protein n=1 Tax=Lentibacillus songyuanensis TaxID=3136161 RepID=UPI0031B9D762
MKLYLKIFTGLLLALTLTGCIGEDYDVGVPIALLYFENITMPVQLTEANISWSSSSGDVEKTKDDIQRFGLSQDELKVSPNEKAFLNFEENEENGGDIWTDPKITVALLKDEQRVEIEMNDSREFRFPIEKGHYVLAVKFISSAGTAQYVGNILIQ